MSKGAKVVTSIAAVLILLFVGASYFLGEQVFKSSTQLATNEKTATVHNEYFKQRKFDIDGFSNTYAKEKTELVSTFDGHTIPADYIYAKGFEGNKNNKTVVLVHGLGGNRFTVYPIGEMFLKMGFNVVAYDQRSSGENTAKYTTFGCWEKYDLIDCLNLVREFAPDKTVGVWGVSFGGATAGQAMGDKEVEKKTDFLVLDCPVSSMERMMSEAMREMNSGIPVEYLVFCGNQVNKMKLGFYYKDADVPTAVKNLEIPVLIINSKADEVIPQFMGQDIYDGINGVNKEIWTVENSRHAEIYSDYYKEYAERLEAIVEKAEKTKKAGE